MIYWHCAFSGSRYVVNRNGMPNHERLKRQGNSREERGSQVLIQMNIFMTNFSAERLWEVDRALPQQVQIGVNINMLDIGQRSDGTLEAPFVFTVSFTPPIAQISIKGKAKISGDSDDTKRIVEEHAAKKPPPAQLIQAVSNAAIADAILLSRSLNIPPPLPPIPQPQAQQGTQKRPDPRYTA